MQNQPKFQPRPGGFGKISARRNDSSSPTDFSRQTKVRPLTPDSLLSEEDLKMTKEQHPCSQNLGMAAAFLLPIAMVRKIRVYPSVLGCRALNREQVITKIGNLMPMPHMCEIICAISNGM